MSESPPSVAAEVAADGPAKTLTNETIETVLADFRSWLQALPVKAALPPPADEPGPDLHTLLGQFIALRHEVTLQTRAARAQQEQTGAALEQLTQALEALRQAEKASRATRQASEEELLRPPLNTLIDLYDVLALAGREMQRVQAALASAVEEMASLPKEREAREWPEPAPPAATSRSWWQRLFGAGPTGQSELTDEIARLRNELHEANRVRDIAERVGPAVESLVAGYGMSLRRIERALHQHGLETIVTAGQPFDPERMEVMEVVTDRGRPSGEVLDEVRRGYLWNGRVFRYAQVRVAKSA
jgi:molecular chaperone GrpE